jgi:hypothetical protein
MRLATLLHEIERSSGPVTGIELADRLGVAPVEVAAMLDALRASGRLIPESSHPESRSGCPGVGSCSMSCPGPDQCVLTVQVNVTDLRIRPAGGRRN